MVSTNIILGRALCCIIIMLYASVVVAHQRVARIDTSLTQIDSVLIAYGSLHDLKTIEARTPLELVERGPVERVLVTDPMSAYELAMAPTMAGQHLDSCENSTVRIAVIVYYQTGVVKSWGINRAMSLWYERKCGSVSIFTLFVLTSYLPRDYVQEMYRYWLD